MHTVFTVGFSNMRTWIFVIGAVSLIGVGALLFFVYSNTEPVTGEQPLSIDIVSEKLPASNSSIVIPEPVASTDELSDAEIVRWYGDNLVPITIGSQSRLASVADTLAERQLGLSGTPVLPPEIVKLFVFDSSSTWSFWMKDMQYPIDIIWLDEDKTVVHVVSEVSPDSYPQSFVPPVAARYVIETVSGFSEEYNISAGTKINFDL